MGIEPEPERKKRPYIRKHPYIRKNFNPKPFGKIPFVGVYLDITTNKFVARCTHNEIAYRIGSYNSALEASEARESFVADLIANGPPYRPEKKWQRKKPSYRPAAQNKSETPYGSNKSRFYTSSFELDAA